MTEAMVPSTQKTRAFYDALSRGDVSRGLWGLEKRFDAEKIISSPSVDRHFRAMVRPHIAATDRVLDVGCGPGGFTAILAEMSNRVVGVDVSEEFVDAANRTFARRELAQANAVPGSATRLPFDGESFDIVTLIDVIHHLDSPAAALKEISRVLRPGGRLLVFEPNKLNPVLTFLCLFDPNEYGFLKMGTIPIYRRLLSGHFVVENATYNGLLIGPDGPAARAVADSLQAGRLASWLGWLSPKLFLVARKP